MAGLRRRMVFGRTGHRPIRFGQTGVLPSKKEGRIIVTFVQLPFLAPAATQSWSASLVLGPWSFSGRLVLGPLEPFPSPGAHRTLAEPQSAFAIPGRPSPALHPDPRLSRRCHLFATGSI